MEKEKYYITTAIAYTSRKPHIGNTYEIVLTDAIARYQRLIGKDVFFLTGTDESLISGNSIGKYNFIGVAYVRLAGGICNCRGYIIFFFFHCIINPLKF